MFELVQIAKRQRFVDRIFPIVLNDAKIYKPIDRIKYVQHWEDEIKQRRIKKRFCRQSPRL